MRVTAVDRPLSTKQALEQAPVLPYRWPAPPKRKVYTTVGLGEDREHAEGAAHVKVFTELGRPFRLPPGSLHLACNGYLTRRGSKAYHS